MTTFLKVDDGDSVNLKYIKRIYWEKRLEVTIKGDKCTAKALVAEDKNGNTYLVDDHGIQKHIYGPTTIIPNTTPMTLILILADNNESEIRRYPIIAWRISPNDCPYPISPSLNSDVDQDFCLFIELPSGRFVQVGYDALEFDTMDECINEVKRRYEILVERVKKRAESRSMTIKNVTE